MREKALLYIFLAAIAVGAFADADLTFGTNGEASLVDAVSFGIEPFLKGTWSMTAPLSEELSALADASSRVGYGWPGQGLTYFGYAAADISYRSGAFFGKLGATSTLEGDGTGNPPELVVASDVETTLDFSFFTISFSPTLRWKQSDTRRWEAEGAFSSIVSAGDLALLRARLEGGVAWPDAGTPEWFAAASVGASWYPGTPLVVSVDAGFRKSVATNSLPETVDGSIVSIPNANGYTEAFLSGELSASLGRDLRLGILGPVRCRIADHGAVEGATVIAETEWLLSFSPAVSMEVSLSTAFALKATFGADLAFSNSSYREESVTHLTIEAILSIE